MQSKSQEQEVDCTEPDASVDGYNHAVTQLFVRAEESSAYLSG